MQVTQTQANWLMNPETQGMIMQITREQAIWLLGLENPVCKIRIFSPTDPRSSSTFECFVDLTHFQQRKAVCKHTKGITPPFQVGQIIELMGLPPGYAFGCLPLDFFDAFPYPQEAKMKFCHFMVQFIRQYYTTQITQLPVSRSLGAMF